MELKTLKDLNWIAKETIKGKKSERCYSHTDLRQEAIKWVKQHRNIKPNWAKETNEEFFMAFFNLTEEELSNGKE